MQASAWQAPQRCTGDGPRLERERTVVNGRHEQDWALALERLKAEPVGRFSSSPAHSEIL